MCLVEHKHIPLITTKVNYIMISESHYVQLREAYNLFHSEVSRYSEDFNDLMTDYTDGDNAIQLIQNFLKVSFETAKQLFVKFKDFFLRVVSILGGIKNFSPFKEGDDQTLGEMLDKKTEENQNSESESESDEEEVEEEPGDFNGTDDTDGILGGLGIGLASSVVTNILAQLLNFKQLIAILWDMILPSGLKRSKWTINKIQVAVGAAVEPTPVKTGCMQWFFDENKCPTIFSTSKPSKRLFCSIWGVCNGYIISHHILNVFKNQRCGSGEFVFAHVNGHLWVHERKPRDVYAAYNDGFVRLNGCWESSTKAILDHKMGRCTILHTKPNTAELVYKLESNLVEYTYKDSTDGDNHVIDNDYVTKHCDSGLEVRKPVKELMKPEDLCTKAMSFEEKQLMMVLNRQMEQFLSRADESLLLNKIENKRALRGFEEANQQLQAQYMEMINKAKAEEKPEEKFIPDSADKYQDLFGMKESANNALGNAIEKAVDQPKHVADVPYLANIIPATQIHNISITPPTLEVKTTKVSDLNAYDVWDKDHKSFNKINLEFPINYDFDCEECVASEFTVKNTLNTPLGCSKEQFLLAKGCSEKNVLWDMIVELDLQIGYTWERIKYYINDIRLPVEPMKIVTFDVTTLDKVCDNVLFELAVKYHSDQSVTELVSQELNYDIESTGESVQYIFPVSFDGAMDKQVYDLMTALCTSVSGLNRRISIKFVFRDDCKVETLVDVSDESFPILDFTGGKSCNQICYDHEPSTMKSIQTVSASCITDDMTIWDEECAEEYMTQEELEYLDRIDAEYMSSLAGFADEESPRPFYFDARHTELLKKYQRIEARLVSSTVQWAEEPNISSKSELSNVTKEEPNDRVWCVNDSYVPKPAPNFDIAYIPSEHMGFYTWHYPFFCTNKNFGCFFCNLPDCKMPVNDLPQHAHLPKEVAVLINTGKDCLQNCKKLPVEMQYIYDDTCERINFMAGKRVFNTVYHEYWVHNYSLGADTDNKKIVLKGISVDNTEEAVKILAKNFPGKKIKVFNADHGVKIYGIESNHKKLVSILLKDHLSKEKAKEERNKRKAAELRNKEIRLKKEVEELVNANGTYKSSYAPTKLDQNIRQKLVPEPVSTYVKAKRSKKAAPGLTYGNLANSIYSAVQDDKVADMTWSEVIIGSEVEIINEQHALKQVLSCMNIPKIPHTLFPMFKTNKGYGIPIKDKSGKVISNLMLKAKQNHVSGYLSAFLKNHNLKITGRYQMAGFNACVPMTWFDFWKEVDPVTYEAKRGEWWGAIKKAPNVWNNMINNKRIALKPFLDAVQATKYTNLLIINQIDAKHVNAAFHPSTDANCNKIMCLRVTPGHCDYVTIHGDYFMVFRGLSCLFNNPVKYAQKFEKEALGGLLEDYYPDFKDMPEADKKELIKTSLEFRALAGESISFDKKNDKIVAEVKAKMSLCEKKRACKDYLCCIAAISSKYMLIKGMEYDSDAVAGSKALSWKAKMLEDCLKQGLCFFNYLNTRKATENFRSLVKAISQERDWAPYVIPNVNELLEVTDDNIWSIYCMSQCIVKAWDKLKPQLDGGHELKTKPAEDTKLEIESKPKEEIKIKFEKSTYEYDPIPISKTVGGKTVKTTKRMRNQAHNIQLLRRTLSLPVPNFSWVEEVEVMRSKVVNSRPWEQDGESRGKMSNFYNKPISKDTIVDIEFEFATGYYFNLTPVYDINNLFIISNWKKQTLTSHDFFIRSIINRYSSAVHEDSGRESIIRAMENMPSVYLNSAKPEDHMSAKRIAMFVLMAQANKIPSIQVFLRAPGGN